MNYTLYGPLVTNYAVVNGGWERVKKLDIGIDLELFRQLTITADYLMRNVTISCSTAKHGRNLLDIIQLNLGAIKVKLITGVLN